MPAVEQSKIEQIIVPAPEYSGTGATSIHSSRMDGNHVIASDEHVTMHHHSGTVVQISSAGSVIIYSATDDIWNYGGNLIEVARSGKDIIVQGGNVNIEVKNGHCNLTVQGNMNHVVKGDYTLEVSGKMNILCGEQFEAQGAKIGIHAYTDSTNITSKNGMYLSTEGDVGLIANNSIALSSLTGGMDIMLTRSLDILTAMDMRLSSREFNVNSLKDVNLHAVGGKMNIMSAGNMALGSATALSVTGGNKLSLASTSGDMHILSGTVMNVHSKGNKIDIQNGTAVAGNLPTPAWPARPLPPLPPTKNEAPKLEPRSALPQDTKKNRTRPEAIGLNGAINRGSDPDSGGQLDA